MTEDQVNTFAAFEFLKELRERKKREERGREGGERVLFKTPSKRARKGPSEAEEKAAVLSGAGVGAGVIKMAEYVVGGGGQGEAQGPRGKGRRQVVGEESEPANVTSVSAKKTSVNLSHLLELEDEDCSS